MIPFVWLALACKGPEATEDRQETGRPVTDDSGGGDGFVSLEDGHTGLGLGVAALMLRDAADRWRFGLRAGDEACPVEEEEVYRGGCAAAGGAVFAGTLRSDEGRWTGEGWRVEGGPDFAVLALDGVWATEGDRERGQRSTLEGTLLVRTGSSEDPRDRFLGEGVEGSLVFEGAWSEAVDLHTVEATLTVLGQGPVTLSLRLEQHAGACSTGLPDAGSLVVASGPERAEYTIAGEAACAGCWGWRYNGEEAGEVCF